MSLNAKMALEDRGSITQQGMFCLEFVWADSTYEFFFITVPVLSVEGEKKRTRCTESWLLKSALKNSGNKSRDGKGRLQHPRDHRPSANSSSPRALRTPASPAAREEMGGSGESSVTPRGRMERLVGKEGGAAALVFNGEPRRAQTARKASGASERSDFSTSPEDSDTRSTTAKFPIMVLIWTQFGMKHKNGNVKCKVRVMHRGDSSGSSSSAVSFAFFAGKFLGLFVFSMYEVCKAARCWQFVWTTPYN